MRVLVTGGTGNVGKETVHQLVQAGHQVTVIGRSKGLSIPGAEYRVCDTTDYDALRQQVEGMEGIVHLAAIPYPGGATSPEIFRINCAGTFNVYHAASEVGIKRVVTASSINAFGFNFGVKGFPLEYLPIDEEHPTFTTDPYSFSKQVTEDIADYYWRRDGISGVCLRLPAVIDAQGGSEDARIGVKRETLALLDQLKQDKTAGQERVERVRALLETRRRERGSEKKHERGQQAQPDRVLMNGYSNFFTGLDTRDSAQAFLRGLTASYEGSHTLFVNDSENVVGVPSQELASLFYPEVMRYRTPLEGNTALVSIERARKLLGFEPRYHIAKIT